MTNDEQASMGGDQLMVGEQWSQAAGTGRALERAVRRGRTPRFPSNLSLEGYRSLLLERIDVLARADTTDEERAETAAWRQAVTEAPAQELRAALTSSIIV